WCWASAAGSRPTRSPRCCACSPRAASGSGWCRPRRLSASSGRP
ncbi:MAG: Phosphopantothenoylcysteine decarboxylase / Phosphopantothenoylcysteine synthetase, partial [uncultured Quadrisphaera sp.]